MSNDTLFVSGPHLLKSSSLWSVQYLAMDFYAWHDILEYLARLKNLKRITITLPKWAEKEIDGELDIIDLDQDLPFNIQALRRSVAAWFKRMKERHPEWVEPEVKLRGLIQFVGSFSV